MNDPFQELRERIAGRIRGSAALRGLEVMAEEEADLEQKIKANLAKGTGVVIWVFEPEILEVNSNVAPIMIDHLEIRIRLGMNPFIAAQRGLPSASVITLNLLGLFSDWDAGIENIGNLYPDDRSPVRDIAAAGRRIKDIVFRTEATYALQD